MYNRICCFAIIFLQGSPAAFSQILSGKIFRKASMEVLSGINVKNSSVKRYSTSDMGGNYRVQASPGDTVIFSSAGYQTDTLVASNEIINSRYDVYLTVNVVALAAVEIDPLTKYIADSIQRRAEYAFILNKKHPIKLMNEKRAADPPGFNFSPIGFFSKHENKSGD